MWRIVFLIIRLILLLVFPFFIFIKSAIHVHTNYEVAPIISILFAVLILACTLFLYVTVMYKLIFKKMGSAGLLKHKLIFTLLVVIGFAFHLLFFISNSNLKNKELQNEYTQLHPILRLATSLLVKIDKNIVVTDAARKLKDYESMGISPNQRSLHMLQKDSYAYALDLRTRNRTEFQILLMQMYYKLLGFKVIRHVGTADHLHISLFCPKDIRI